MTGKIAFIFDMDGTIVDNMDVHMRVWTDYLAGLGCSRGVDGKVPIRTSSEVALNQYLKGRNLSEKLRGQESIEHFEKAISEDPDFAMAHLQLAFVTPSAKAFSEGLDRAAALVDKVSEGERLWILGAQAGVNGYAMQQQDYFQKLVAAYPNDERAHTLLGNHYFGQREYALALEDKKWDQAIEELEQANQQNPYNFYRIARAYAGKGDTEAAKEYCEKAANFNALNSLNYAFVKNQALRMLESM